MEEFIVRNYVYHNLRDLLFRINKLHPDFLTEEYLERELECLQKYINSIKFTNAPDPIESFAVSLGNIPVGHQPACKNILHPTVPEVNVEPIITTAKEPKAKHPPRKAKAESNAIAPVTPTQPQFTFNMTQFQVGNSQVSPIQEQVKQVRCVNDKNATSTDRVTSCQCVARVLGSSRNPMAHDYVSYGDDATKSKPIYGRRCKNVMMDNGPFCAVHKKKCEYGIFTDEASAEVRELCMKKYTRLKEIEDVAKSTNTLQ